MRRIRMILFRFFVLVVVLASISLQVPSIGKETGTEASPPLEQRPRGNESVEAATGDKWKDDFAFIRDQVRFEPSMSLLKSPQGVIWARRGNSFEKASALAELLRDSGEKVRFAEGKLSGDRAAELIRSIFPGAKDLSYGPDVLLSDPARDKSLLASVQNHAWIQIYKDGQWLDLDPSFPKSDVGKAYARLEKTYDDFPDEMKVKLTILLGVEKGLFNEGDIESRGKQTIFRWRGDCRDISNQPLSLTIAANFEQGQEKKKEKKEDEEEEGGAAGVWGGLTGGKKEKKADKSGLMEAVYQARLAIKGKELASGKFSEIVPSDEEEEQGEVITRVWLDFQAENAVKKILESKRFLFEKEETETTLPLFQRHAILVSANQIPQSAWQDELRAVTDDKLLGQLKSGIEEIKKSLEAKKALPATLKKSLSLEERIGPALGHVINMIFASTSDEISEKAAQALSVFPYFNRPRLIITSFEGTGEDEKVSLDLRQDSMEAVAFPGQALGMKRSFLYGRGVMESILEGQVLELFTGKAVLTAARLMQQATTDEVSLRMYSTREKGDLENLDMPGRAKQRALEALDAGNFLILPDQGVDFEGETRWAWWKVNPQTWEPVGVLDTGLHQAMVQRTILETEGPLESKMGFVIGAIVGAVDTQWMIAGMVLKYGDLTKEALEEAKAYMKQINAYMCPGFEKKISATLVSATLIDIEDCYKKEFSIEFEAGVSVDMGWCDKFAKGFACASTTILNYYLSQFEE